MNKIKIAGVVIRETAIKEFDSLILILTAEGLISGIAYGARKPAGSKTSGTRLFCYSEFLIFEKDGNCTIDSAVPIDTFFGISKSAQALAAASYMAEVLGDAALAGVQDNELMRLALVSFYALSQGKRDIATVKAAFELRITAVCGYEPMLDNDGDTFSYIDGCVFNRGEEDEDETTQITQGTLMAMRHIINADMKKLMSFEVTGQTREILIQICEKYLQIQFDKKYKTLSIYKSIAM